MHTNNFIPPQLLLCAVAEAFKKHFEYWPEADTEETKLKRQFIERLIAADVLEYPTQGLIAAWLQISILDLIELETNGRHFENTLVFEKAPHELESECHALAAINWVLNPTLEVYTGISDKEHLHSWLYDPSNKRVLEPTPYGRNSYFGFLHEDPLEFAEAEEERITALHKSGLIPDPLFLLYKDGLCRLLSEKDSG